MARKKSQYYTVWEGRVPGVYDSWVACEVQVKGVAAKYKGFQTREEAEKALQEDWRAYFAVGARKKSEKAVTPMSAVVRPFLAVDAACSGNPGLLEFRGVIEDSGVEAFHRGPLECGTNNIGEFLAIVLGLAWLKQNNLPWVLYSDSRTAQAWVRAKKCKSKLEMNEKNRMLWEMVRSAEHWLLTNSWTTQIIKWDTEHWGEIPADFGRK